MKPDMKNLQIFSRPLAAMAAIAAAVSCGNGESGFDATGIFEADEITVSSEATGRIERLDISEGSSVSRGDLLGIIDTVQLSLRKEQLVNTMRSVEYSIPDTDKQTAYLMEQIDKQKAEKARTERLLESDAATRKQYDDICSAISVLESQLDATNSSLDKNVSSLRAQAASLKAQISQIQDQIDRCRLSSPIDGTVLSLYMHEGELATPGRPLFRVADTRHMYLRAYFTLGQLSDVKIGQKVRVTADFGGDNLKEYPGTVSWISEKSEFTPRSIQTSDDRENLVYAVKIAIENDGYVKIGMYGKVVL